MCGCRLRRLQTRAGEMTYGSTLCRLNKVWSSGCSRDADRDRVVLLERPVGKLCHGACCTGPATQQPRQRQHPHCARRRTGPPWPPADLAAGRARAATTCAFNRHRPIESNRARRTATGEHVCTYPTRSRASTGERRGRVRVFVTGGGRYAQQTRRLAGADRKPRTAASSSSSYCSK